MDLLLTIDLKKLAPLLLAIPLIIISLLIGYPEPELPVSAPARPAPVLVIDPGHGGEDGGAVGVGGVLESELNLSVALRLEALAGFMGVESVMTRRSEDIDYPEEAKTTAQRKKADQRGRVELINSTPGAVLISVHQNCFPSAGPSGPQALYGKAEGSSDFGALVHEALSAAACPDNRRVAAPVPDNIFLFKNLRCPAVLAECGFISNPGEAALLMTDERQIKISAALLTAYLQFTAPPEDVENG